MTEKIVVMEKLIFYLIILLNKEAVCMFINGDLYISEKYRLLDYIKLSLNMNSCAEEKCVIFFENFNFRKTMT